MAAFGCHQSNHCPKRQNTGSRYVGARLWCERFLLTEASITAHQRQQLKQNEAKTNQHQPTRDELAPRLLRTDCLNGISSMQIVLASQMNLARPFIEL